MGGKTIRVFRSDVSPLWEDKANANGGKLGLIVKEGDQADSMFLKIVAAMVRGELSCTDQINGVVLSSDARATPSPCGTALQGAWPTVLSLSATFASCST